MHARLARYAIEPDRVDDAVESFREAGRELSQLDGFAAATSSSTMTSGTLMTLTLWKDRAALDASDVRAASAAPAAVRADARARCSRSPFVVPVRPRA